MKAKMLFFLSMTLLSCIGLFYLLNQRSITPLEEVKDRQLETSPPNEMIVEERNYLPTRSIATISKKETSNFRSSLPDQEEVKHEAGENPHQTPESLVKFADASGQMMDKAIRNIEDANFLLGEFSDCVMNERIALSAKALCLSHSEKLANMHPQLQERVSQLREQASPEVVKLLKQKNLLLKR